MYLKINPILLYMIEQGSREWHKQRRMHFTSSEIEVFCKPKGLGDLAMTYIYDTISEIITDFEFDPDSFETKATLHGKTYEPLAKEVYAKMKNVIVEEAEFVEHHDFKYWGGSSDGKVYDNGTGDDFGIVEVKCPFVSGNHLKHMRITSVKYFKDNFPKYYWQCMSNMIISNVQYCDFISFDPRMSKRYGLFVFRLFLNDEEKKFLIGRVVEARKLMNEICTELSIEIK